MNWLRLLEIIEMARARTGNPPTKQKPDRGWNWQCYCVVCSALRRLAA